MKILITDSENKRVMIEVNENENVKTLMDKLKNKKNISREIILHYNGEILEENETISSYGIADKSVIIYMGRFLGGSLYIYF